MTRVSCSLALSTALLIGALGCSMAPRGATGAPSPVARPAAGATATTGSAGGGASGTLALALPRQLIRRGSVGVTVDTVESSRRHLERAASSLGAFVAHLDAKGSEYAAYHFRVPPDRLDALMDSAATLGAVRERTVSSDEVTDQIVDAESRIAALRASRDRLQALMDRAGGITDVITVERELARVQAELESYEARVSSLQSQVALSEASVRLDQKHTHVLGPLAVVGVGIAKVFRKLFIWN
jgi:hypothetical protein